MNDGKDRKGAKDHKALRAKGRIRPRGAKGQKARKALGREKADGAIARRRDCQSVVIPALP